MLKEGRSVDDVYTEAKGLANLEKIQNIKQKVIKQENPVGHSFEALAKIKESSDKIDKYLLWSVEDGRVSQSKITAVFRSSKERIEIISQMQRGGTHSLGNEYCFLDAEHDKVKGMKTINLSVQHPVLKECDTCKHGLHDGKHRNSVQVLERIKQCKCLIYTYLSKKYFI